MAHDLQKYLSSEEPDQPLTGIAISALAKHMLDWQTKATVLGLSEVEMEDIKENYDTNNMRKVALLRRWKEKYGHEATLGYFLAIAKQNEWMEELFLGVRKKRGRSFGMCAYIGACVVWHA